MSLVTLTFLAALIVSTGIRVWLKLRQMQHVAAHRPAVPPAFADRITLASHQKAADYTLDRCRLALAGLVIDALFLLAMTLGGGLAALNAFWLDHTAGLAYGLALIFSFGALSTLVELPMGYVRQFGVEARHGFNRMTPALFFSDLAKQLALGLLFGVPLVSGLLWLLTSTGPLWWLWAWALWSVFNLFLMFVYPAWIAPLFNRFAPLPAGEARQAIEALLARCGFAAADLFMMDGSRRSSHGNAYFTGFGRHRRIVFFDTLLDRLSPAEIVAVLAHELGHFKRHHIVQRIALGFATSFAALWVLGQALDQPAFYGGLGIVAESATPALGVLLFVMVLPLLTFGLTPLLSLLSRRNEFEADDYAVAHSSADDLIRALVKLYDDNAATLTPDPLHSAFHDSHPPAARRIAHLQGKV